MGLDMTLTAKKYFSSFEKKKGKKDAIQIKKLFPEMRGNKLDYVIFDVGYWRKANAIHKWFVDNVQEGKDDCETYTVGRSDLQALKNNCKEVICTLMKAKKTTKKEVVGRHSKNGKWVDIIENVEVYDVKNLNLPPQEGFFFGSTLINEWYLQDMKHTIKIINKVLKLGGEWDIEYRSSW